jgi:hypothetical protein
MVDQRSHARRLRVVVLAFVFFPDVAIVLLLGFGVNWYLAGVAAFAWPVTFGLIFGVRHSHVLGRVIGNEGWDPLDYAQWTRYLVVRPLIVALPAGFAVSVAAIAGTLAGLTFPETLGVGAAAGLVGFAVGGWIWLRREDAHRAKAE